MPAEIPHDADVLIVGMGPTGVALAGLLGQAGVRTAVFDKLPDLYPLPRAAAIDHEAMRIAQQLGLADRLRPHVTPYRASEYRGVDGQVIKRLDSPPPPHRSGWDPMLAFDQPAFEHLLRDRVRALPAVTASLDCEVTSFGQDEGSVWAAVRPIGSAATTRVSGRYLVACDGGASPTREALGITMTDLGFHENWLVVDAVIDDDDALQRLPSSQVQYCDPRRPATYVSLVGRRRRWEIMLDAGELPVGAVAVEDVWPWLQQWITPGEARILRSAAYMFHALVADEWRRERIFLAGDAAHMTPPFMAQGMAQGMRDAQNLAWKLTAALRAEAAADQLLGTYQQERRPHVLATTMRTIELGRVICERDEIAARQRDRDLVGEDGEAVPVTYRSTFLPPLAAGPLVDTASPGAGHILPQPYVTQGARTCLLDDVAGYGFRLIATSALTDDERTSLEHAIAPIGGRVLRIHRAGSATSAAPTELVERDDVMNTWLAELGSTIAIARPDHYVYATAPTAERALIQLTDLVAAVDGYQHSRA